MRFRALLLGAAASLWLLPLSAGATLFTLDGSLDGLQETPPNASPASGFANVTYDDTTNVLSWDVSYQNLLGAITAAHFHQAPPGVAGAVQVPIAIGASPLLGSAVITAAQGAQLLAGNWYVNIHSTVFPGGEIRGQLALIPEPATALLLGGGLALLAHARRRIS